MHGNELYGTKWDYRNGLSQLDWMLKKVDKSRGVACIVHLFQRIEGIDISIGYYSAAS
jgi:hypothetical protein